jgi:hypothetical protein
MSQSEQGVGTARKGMAGYIFLAMQYVKNNSEIKAKLKKKNLHIRLALESPDFMPAALIVFDKGTVEVKSLSVATTANKSQWDVKMIAPAKVLLDYFIGRLGTLRPFLFFTIKTDSIMGLIKLTSLIWYVKEQHKFFGTNRSYAEGVLAQLYHKKNEYLVD